MTLTVVKLDTRQRVKLCYPADLVEWHSCGVVLTAAWALPARDLGDVRVEPGDRFTEYYYTDRWFDVQEVARADGRRKGWYCDIAEPAVIEGDQFTLVDLELDVWVSAAGEPLILDEDEFVDEWGRRRLHLKPGITGPWQVLGRTDIPFEEMVKLDYLYVTNWSLFADLKLMLRTVPAVMRGAEAS